MAVIFEMTGARERIINNALALVGSQHDDRAEALFEVALLDALSRCNRDDVPYKMEGAIAIMLADLMRNGGQSGVKSLTRGDVSVTYSEKGGNGVDLAPFVKMRAI